MHAAELALWALLGWTAIGLVGVTLSFRRRDIAKVRRGLAWILGVWVLYLGVLAGVSRLLPQRRLPLGSDLCFDTICYAAVSTDEFKGFTAPGPTPISQAPERLLRVSVRIRNIAPTGVAAQPRITAVLVDGQGRSWHPLPGLGGVRLTAPMVAGHTVVSQPVFRVAPGASHLSVVLSKGNWHLGLLQIGNTDSWLHLPVLLDLDR